MSIVAAAALAKSRWFPAVLGLGSIAGAHPGLVEMLIRLGLINRFIVPMPSEIFLAFPRIVAEEHVLSRFLLTVAEAFSASILVTVFGVAGGVLLHRSACCGQATETWVAAVAAAPLVLIYPLYLVIFGRNATTIVMMGFTAGVAPTDPQDARGPLRHAARPHQCRPQLQSHARRSSSGRSCSRPRCRPSSSGCGLA